MSYLHFFSEKRGKGIRRPSRNQKFKLLLVNKPYQIRFKFSYTALESCNFVSARRSQRVKTVTAISRRDNLCSPISSRVLPTHKSHLYRLLLSALTFFCSATSFCVRLPPSFVFCFVFVLCVLR